MVSTRVCDHTSAGMIVPKGCFLLLIKRGTPPYGMAPPAGHVDGDPLGFEGSARRELQEEVGLRVLGPIRLLFEGKKENHCRREQGTWHYWKVYEISRHAGKVKGDPRETTSVNWYTRQEIHEFADRTKAYLNGMLSEQEWQEHPGLEPVWLELFQEMSLI